MAYGADTTADEVLEGVDLSGALALVTGAAPARERDRGGTCLGGSARRDDGARQEQGGAALSAVAQPYPMPTSS